MIRSSRYAAPAVWPDPSGYFGQSLIADGITLWVSGSLLLNALGAPPHSPDTIRDVLSGGDDYELLFSAAPENRAAITALGGSLQLALTRIGAIVAGEGIRLLDARGAQVRIDARGFDHFA